MQLDIAALEALPGQDEEESLHWCCYTCGCTCACSCGGHGHPVIPGER